MTRQKRIAIGDFLTQEQAKAAVVLWAKHGASVKFIDAVVNEIVAPNIAEINRKLGQENDPRYLAFAIQYVFIQTSEGQ